jgi:SH3-like domain-containing protein
MFPLHVFAQEVGESTGLPMPRFASLNAEQVFARMGPGTRFPIKWTYQRANLPVEIIDEFDNWRKIRDIDGEEGWVHQSLLSGKRFVIQHNGENMPLYRKNIDTSRQTAIAESGAILALDSCENQWCEVNAMGLSGWIQKEFLWGVYEGEQIQ